MSLHGWLYLFNLLGTLAFAFSGALAGIKKNMDIFGIFMLAIVTSSGGGVLRSVLINEYPLGFFRDPSYIVIAAVATIIVFYTHAKVSRYSRALLTFDAFGLAVFMSTGTSIALNYNMTFWASIIMGVVTAAFGGVIRDVLCAEVPLIFRKELYVTAALLGGLVYFLLFRAGVEQSYVIAVAAVIVFLIRVLSLKYKWSLPRSSA